MLARLPYCISSPKPLLGSVLRQTTKNLDLIQASSDDTIGLVDLCTRQDALASILGVQQHVRCGVYGLQAEVFTLFDAFQNCSFLCFKQQLSGQGSTDFISYICKQSLNIRQDGVVIPQSVQWLQL